MATRLIGYPHPFSADQPFLCRLGHGALARASGCRPTAAARTFGPVPRHGGLHLSAALGQHPLLPGALWHVSRRRVRGAVLFITQMPEPATANSAVRGRPGTD